MDEEAKRTSILIVDDDAAFCRLLQRYLSVRSCSLEVYRSEDGERALCMMESVSFDLVITDFHLPGIDGEAVVRNIKKNYNVPVIGMSSANEARRFVNAGVDRYLQKPFSVTEFEKAIGALIPL